MSQLSFRYHEFDDCLPGDAGEVDPEFYRDNPPRFFEEEDDRHLVPPDDILEEVVADHEAAHLVIAGYNGLRIGKDDVITVVPDIQKGSLGRVTVAGLPMPPKGEQGPEGRTPRRELLMRRLCCLFAGGAVNQMWHRNLRGFSDENDQAMAHKMAKEEGDEFVPLLTRAERRVRQQVRRLLPAITKVADALVLHKTLRAEDALKYAFTGFTDGQLRFAAYRGPSIPGADLHLMRHWRDHPVELHPHRPTCTSLTPIV